MARRGRCPGLVGMLRTGTRLHAVANPQVVRATLMIPSLLLAGLVAGAITRLRVCILVGVACALARGSSSASAMAAFPPSSQAQASALPTSWWARQSGAAWAESRVERDSRPSSRDARSDGAAGIRKRRPMTPDLRALRRRLDVVRDRPERAAAVIGSGTGCLRRMARRDCPTGAKVALRLVRRARYERVRSLLPEDVWRHDPVRSGDGPRAASSKRVASPWSSRRRTSPISSP
jgi:hypothetical protein